MNETSFAHIVFATGVLGKPRPVGGELHKNPLDGQLYIKKVGQKAPREASEEVGASWHLQGIY
jgi:hypothetical protein